MSLGNDSVTLKRINEQNTLFWREQSELTLKRLSDKTLFDWAKKEMDSEILRGVSARERKTLEQLLADLAGAKSDFQPDFLADFSRRGGKASKRDALQVLIGDIRNRRPTITPGQLLCELEGDSGTGVVTRIESQADVLAGESRKIHYEDDDGRRKTASVSGLRYRLARARKK